VPSCLRGKRMLAPNLLDLETDIADTANVLRRIGAFAQSCLSAQVGQIVPPPVWLDDVLGKLSDCRAIATGWLNAQIEIVPPLIICFKNYAASLSALIETTRSTTMDPDTWNALLIDLRDRAAANSDTMRSVASRMKELNVDFAVAHRELREAMQKASEAHEAEHGDIERIAGKLGALFARLKDLDAGSSAEAMSAGRSILGTSVNLTYIVFTEAGAAIPYVGIAIMLFSVGHSLFVAISEDAEITQILNDIEGLMIELDDDVRALAVTHALIAMLDSMNEAYIGAAQQLPRLNEYWDSQKGKIDIVLEGLKSNANPDYMTELRSLPTALAVWDQAAKVASAMALQTSDEGKPVELKITASPRRKTSQIKQGAPHG
jgi:hypothetical protein